VPGPYIELDPDPVYDPGAIRAIIAEQVRLRLRRYKTAVTGRLR
jgi:hypothetical protein